MKFKKEDSRLNNKHRAMETSEKESSRLELKEVMK